MDDFLPASGIDWQGPDVGMVRYGSDNQVVIFYNKSVPNPAKAQENGRPYNEDKIYVRMHPPGERLNIIDRPARLPEDSRRFPVQWAQFQQAAEQTAPGTPIELLHPQQPSIAANLRANGVQTIEQCAELSGQAIDSMGMGAQHWSNDAKKYLEAAQKGVHYTHMKHELDQRDSKIRVLERQLEELRTTLSKVAPNGVVQPVGVTPEQIAAIVASMQGVPQYPPPGVQPTRQFDTQAAQIAATHESALTKPVRGMFDSAQPPVHPEVAKKRGRPRKAADSN